MRERQINVTRHVGHYHRSMPVSSAKRGRLAAGLVCGARAAPLAGCAVSMPIATLSGSNDDVTGSIRRSSLEETLDTEDWRRARAALATALDPQGNGAEVGWDNPQSGVKGVFAAAGKPYPSDSRVCRAFQASLQRKASAEKMEGVACADKSGDWSIAEIRPVRT